MAGCTRRHDCPLFERLSMSSSSRIWRLLYCENDKKFKTCARFEAGLRGETIPINLLPNGQLLKTTPSGADDDS